MYNLMNNVNDDYRYHDAMIYLLAAISVTVAIFYYFCIRPLSFWKKLGVKQGRPLWVFGDTFRKFVEIESRAEQDTLLYNRFPESRYHGFYNFTLPSLYVRDPELIKKVLVKDFEYFTDRLPFISNLKEDPLWSKNILQLQGQEWKDIRLLLSPAFTSAKMKTMYNLISDDTKPFMVNLSKYGDSFELNVKDMFKRFTNDAIASTAFGVKVDSVTDPKNEFYRQGTEAVRIEFRELLRMAGFWFFGPNFYKVFNTTLSRPSVSKFFLNLIDDTVTAREKNNIVRPDMLQLLMDTRKDPQKERVDDEYTGDKNDKEKSSNKKLTNEDIAAQAFIFFFGGFDTISSLLIFTFYELALNPDIQKRLREEIIDTYKTSGENLAYETLMKMKYMDMVISESMRKWPNMIAFNRACSKSYTIDPVLPDEKPLRLEKGTVVVLPIFGMHRDPKYFPDPEKFDPERFNEENKGNINPYVYIPFGLGPRNCIGNRFALMETKIFIFHFLLNFEVYPVEKTQIPVKLCTKSFGLSPKGDLVLGIRRLKM